VHRNELLLFLLSWLSVCLVELKSNHGVSDVGRSVGSNGLSICLGDTMMRLTYVVGCVLELVGLGCMEWKGPATIEDS
jgi:hypothetical protein